MSNQISANFPRASCLYRRALGLLFFYYSFFSVFAGPRDTVILDGLPVEVDQTWEYDTVYIQRSALGKAFRFLDVHAGMLGGRSFISSSLPDWSSPGEITGKEAFWTSSPSISCEAAWMRSEHFYLRTGISYSKQSWKYLSFDKEVIDDSLFRFFAEGEEMKQLLLYRFGDLGSETDTLPLPLRSHSTSYSTIDFPIRMCYETKVERSNSRIEINLGVSPRLVIASSSGNLALVSEVSPEYDILTADESKPADFQLFGSAGFAWNIKPANATWSWGMKTEFNAPLLPIDSSDKFQVQRLETALGLFFRFFSR
jgi:hypothetical protein